jgi:hypothetical protein
MVTTGNEIKKVASAGLIGYARCFYMDLNMVCAGVVRKKDFIMKHITFLCGVLSIILIVSTGCSENDEYKRLKQHRFGDCGSEVISDYNSLVSACPDNLYLSRDRGKQCITEVDEFVFKYPAINCRAEVYRTTRPITITTDLVLSLKTGSY